MAIITISRQYGSGGDEIAARLCEVLGYRYFDKSVMAQIASEIANKEGVDFDLSEDNYRSMSYLDRLLGTPGLYATELNKSWRRDPPRIQQDILHLDEDQLIGVTRRSIEEVYCLDNFVILGRGGQIILKDKPAVLHVRVEAPMSARVERVCQKEHLERLDAEDRILQRDRAARSYLKRFFGVDWEDPLLYHMVINTGKISLEGASAFIQTILRILPAGV
jgi:CMP/dCMP kinase